MGQFSKKWEDLNFSDNFIFCKVMKNPKLCKKLLEILLDFKIEKIEYLESEHPIQDFYDSRGIRMDVYVRDSEKIYNIEMQTSDYKDLLLRARYYQSACDINSTPRRTKFKDLKETYIIFLCKDDPFGQGLALYTEKHSFLETDTIPYNDKSHKLFYNSSAFAKAKNDEVRDVLEFIYNLKAHSSFTHQLEESVLDAKVKPIYKDEYMYFADILEEEKEEARATGLAEGRATGLAEGRAEGLSQGITEGKIEGKLEGQIQVAKNLLKTDMKIETIAQCCQLPIEKVQELQQEA